ncbi:MAG TPA: DUF3662 and FHA domain-containing protein [Actinomycetales bacterium]|nr:DUF3662 and FHA domain-containing protein [Actinomycetales bacterium]
MGVLDRFEKGIERAVNGAFAKAFRAEVQPVEIASALRRAVDEKAAVIGRGRTLVPNAFVVELGESDHERLQEYADALSDELVANLREHAEHQRYAFVGPVTVAFEQVDELDTGVFRVRSATVKGRQQEARPTRAPDVIPRDLDIPTPPPRAAVPARSQPATRPPRRPWLEVDGQVYPLVGPVTVVGRGDEADVVLDDPGISRRHAELRVTTDGPRLAATVTDLGSTNGTFVNGDQVRSTPLDDGAVITLGRTRATYRSGER